MTGTRKNIKEQTQIQKLTGTRNKNYSSYLLPALIILVFGVFFPSLFNGFVNWDDPVYVTANPLVQKFSWENIVAIFSASFDGHYHPLTLISLSIDRLVAGNNAWFFHFVNLLFHVLNSVLVFWISKKILENSWAAFVVALLFGIHPMNVEAVAWISERKDVLYAFFFLFSLLYYIAYIEKSKKRYFVFSLLFFVLSALSKEQAVTLAPVLLLVDLWYRRKLLGRKVIVEKIPFFLIALLVGLAVIWSQQQTGYIKPLSGETVSFFNRLILGSYGLVMYFFKLIIPVKLSAFYPYPFDCLKIAPAVFWLSLLIIPVLFSLLVVAYRRSRLAFFGLSFFLLNVFFLLRFLQANPGDFVIAERYLYIPSIGLFIIIAKALQKLAENKKNVRNVVIVFFVVVFICLGGLTSIRIQVWKDSLTLLNDILLKHPQVYSALNCRGDVYAEMKNYKAALADFEKAIKLNSRNDRAFANRGRILALTGNFVQAMKDMDRAVLLDPENADNYINRGLVRDLSGNVTGAIKDFDRAVQISRGSPIALVNRGNSKIHLGDYNGAIDDFDLALKSNSELPKAYCRRGTAYSYMGKIKEALNDLNKAIQLEAGDPEIYFERGLVFYKNKNFQKAADDLSFVLKTQAKNGLAYAYRGFSWYNLKKYKEAISDLDRAIELIPGYHLGYAMRGMAYMKSGMLSEACADLHLAANFGNRAAAAEYEKHCGKKE